MSPFIACTSLSGSSGKSCGLGQEGDAGLATRTMAASPSPGEGMAVRVPVVGRLCDGLGDLVPGLEAPPGQGEGAQHLPPRLDQVEVGGVVRLDTIAQRGCASMKSSTSGAR